MTAAIFTSQLRNWNNENYQSRMRKEIMNDFRGIKPITNLELRIKASALEKEIDRTLLDVAVFMELIKLSVND